MNTTAAPDSASVENLLAQITDEFLQRLDAGEQPAIEGYAHRYPAIAEILRQVLPALQVLRGPASGTDAADVATAGCLGDFRIVREVGRGGMGIVYEAEQISLRRRVALKVLPFAATMDSRHLQRFHNEAQAAACLHHGNIVPVYFVGCERGVHFYAMQFIDGQPLSEVIQQLRGRENKDGKAIGGEQTTAYQPPVDDAIAAVPTVRRVADATSLTVEGRRSRAFFRKVAELGVQAAEALDHAHQVGIVHRDVKPANLLVDDRGNLWVTDFGLAQMQSDTRLTRTGDLVGTLRYMSPEQALAKRVVIDHRTDIYSLGATLYELLTLQPAFTGEDREELLRQIAFEEPKRPRQVERAIPAELETIVQKAMEKRPQDRYGTAHELADDLERWLRNEPIHARRPTLLQYTSKWVRRHKPAATASAVVMLIALALASYLAWMQHDREVRQAARRSASAKVLRAALEDSRGWQAERRLPEALSAAQRAVGLLAGADVDEALRQQVQSRLADLQLLEKLENVRLEQGTAVKDGHFDRGATDRLYEQLFREFGLDLEEQSAEQAAERIRRSTVAVEVASMLDEWAVSRGRAKGIDDPSRKTLLRIARLADPDPLRTRVREALETKDRQALQTMSAKDAVFDLPPATLHLLGSALANDKEICGQAEAFLRRAQQRYPQDFWLADILIPFYWNTIQPRQREEAIGFALVAVSLRPNSPGVHNDLGVALMDKNRLEEAIGEFQEAIRLKNDYAGAHSNLGAALMRKGRLDEAINKFKEAIRINTDDPEYHANLADALNDKHQWDQAITESHEAIRLNKEFSGGHYELARALSGKGLWDEALAECRKAIQLNKNNLSAYNGLGSILCDGKHDYDGAITAFREVIRRDKNNANAHHNLGIALSHKGQWDQAASAFREAIQLKTDDARWHSELGKTLVQTGQYLPALEVLRRGRELAANNHRQYQLFSQQVQECENLLELDGKLAAVLSGQKQPADAEERLTLAWMCQRHKQWHAASVRFYREAFAEKPQWASDLRTQHGYNAACAAALAGCGRGKDADKLDANERAGLRRQALDWLRADLKAYRQSLEKSAGKAGPAIARRMQHWLKDDDFAGVRGTESLARLPAAERNEWQRLWKEVEVLRQRTAQAPKTAGSIRP